MNVFPSLQYLPYLFCPVVLLLIIATNTIQYNTRPPCSVFLYRNYWGQSRSQRNGNWYSANDSEVSEAKNNQSCRCHLGDHRKQKHSKLFTVAKKRESFCQKQADSKKYFLQYHSANNCILTMTRSDFLLLHLIFPQRGKLAFDARATC